MTVFGKFIDEQLVFRETVLNACGDDFDLHLFRVEEFLNMLNPLNAAHMVVWCEAEDVASKWDADTDVEIEIENFIAELED